MKLRKHRLTEFILLLILLLHCYIISCADILNNLNKSNLNSKLEEASYFGRSFFGASFKNDSTFSDVRLQFKTVRSSGLIFLASGVTDYLLIGLVDSRVQVEVNLGSGVTKAATKPQTKFNDGVWHVLYLKRSRRQVTLIVDGTHTVNLISFGKHHELNIEWVYLGGVHSSSSTKLSPPFPLTHIEGLPGTRSLRGCLRHPIFNGHNLYELVTDRQDSQGRWKSSDRALAFKMLWTCSSEFDAKSYEALSLSGNSSFFYVGRIDLSSSVVMEIKTRSADALVLYCGSDNLSSNFNKKPARYLTIKLLDGVLKIILIYDNSQHSLYSANRVNDGTWHRVTLVLSASRMVLKVDSSRDIVKQLGLAQEQLHLGPKLYLGGLQPRVNLTSRVGLSANMKACLRMVHVDRRLIGLPSAELSNGLARHCLWSYPCATDPCTSDARCIEIGRQLYDCQCSVGRVCTRPDWKHSNDTIASAQKLARISPIFVREGDSVVITTKNVDLTFRPSDFDLTDSKIGFRLLSSLTSGSLRIGSAILSKYKRFSLVELQQNLVKYVHDGSEEVTDQLLLHLEVNSLPTQLTPSLLTGQTFVLHVIITSINDPPVIIFPKGSRIPVTINDRIKIDTSYLRCKDNDQPSENLEWRIKPRNISNKGTFLLSGRKSFSFTQADVEGRRVVYMNREATSSSFTVTCSDSLTHSQQFQLDFYVVNLTLVVRRNTGLWVRPTGEAILSQYNLSVSSNLDKSNSGDGWVIFSLIEHPKYGVFQRIDPVKREWNVVTNFTQKDIDSDSVKYLGTFLQPRHSGPFKDTVRFNISTQGSYSEELTFLVHFYRVDIFLKRNRRLIIYGELNSKQRITRSRLLTTTNHNDPASTVIYIVTKVSSHGNVFLLSESSIKRRYLGLKSRFTQDDINQGRLYYTFRRVVTNEVKDVFEFKIYVVGAQSESHDFVILYKPQKLSDFELINYGLTSVLEGSISSLSDEVLTVKSKSFSNCEFSILSPCSHGSLELINSKEPGEVVKSGVTIFTSRQLARKTVIYAHDGSESTEDHFLFKVFCRSVQTNRSISMTDNFDIQINLVNDNAPVRVTRETIYANLNDVVALNGYVLKFHDPDIDYNDDYLQYSWTFPSGIDHGQFVASKSRLPLTFFTQESLLKGDVSYIHRGQPLVKISLLVTDGEHTAHTFLTVNVTYPYFLVEEAVDLEVAEGGSTALFFNIILNMVIDPSKIVVRVSQPSKFGVLETKKRPQGATKFSYFDVITYNLFYRHHGNYSGEDILQLQVIEESQAIEASVRVMVKILSRASSTCVMDVERSRLLVTKSGATTLIDPSILGARGNSAQFLFHVVRPPTQGYLIFIFSTFQLDNVTVFRQADLQLGRVFYRHLPKRPVDGLSSLLDDRVQLQLVACGRRTSPFTLHFYVASANLIITWRNMTGTSGDPLSLRRAQLTLAERVQRNNYEAVRFDVVQRPDQGRLYSSRTNKSLDRFSYRDVLNGQVLYKHKGNISQEVNVIIKLSAVDISSGSRSQAPISLGITVRRPGLGLKLIRNTRVDIWKSSSILLTSFHLLAEASVAIDPGSIVYNILSNPEGYLIDTRTNKRKVDRFSQNDINQKKIMLIHNGNSQGSPTIGFTFTLSAGSVVTQEFRFIFTPQRLVARTLHTAMIEVFPGGLMLLSSATLLTVTNDPNNLVNVEYRIIRQPRVGQFTRVDKNGTATGHSALNSFTQLEVNNSQVAYQHTGGIAKFSDVTENLGDNIDLQLITVPPSDVHQIQLPVSIGYSCINRYNQARVIQLRPFEIAEGDKAIIHYKNWNAEPMETYLTNQRVHFNLIRFVLARLPDHGVLTVYSKPALIGQHISHKDLRAGGLVYQHDNSDTTNDAIDFQVAFAPLAKLRGFAQNASFDIRIVPVNDEPFFVTVLQDIPVVETGSIVLSVDHLNATDRDTPPSRLVYTLLQSPEFGELTLSNGDQSTICLKGCRFSQADVLAGFLAYQNTARSNRDLCQVKLTDGAHTSVTKSITFSVLPVSLYAYVQPMTVLQGDLYTVIGIDTINASVKNDNNLPIHFNVTQLPAHGHIIKDLLPTDNFSMKDVVSNVIRYHQIQINASADHFICTVYAGSQQIPNIRGTISVAPLLNTRPLAVPAGRVTTVSSHYLSAALLQTRTGVVPNFTLTASTTYGRLYVLPLKDNPRNALYSQVPFWFTQDEVDKGLLLYEAYSFPYVQEPSVEEVISFTLTAGTRSQPAAGRFALNIVYKRSRTSGPSRGTRPDSSRGSDGSEEEQGFELLHPGNATMFIVTVCCIGGIVLLIVVAIALICWRRYHPPLDSRAGRPVHPRGVMTSSESSLGVAARLSGGPSYDIVPTDPRFVPANVQQSRPICCVGRARAGSLQFVPTNDKIILDTKRHWV